MPGLLEALQEQSDSLEYLRYTHRMTGKITLDLPQYTSTSITSFLSNLREASAGLSVFKRLHTLGVGCKSNLAELLLEASLAPPNLRSLGLTGVSLDRHWGDTWRNLVAFIPAISATTHFSRLRLYTTPSCSEFHHLHTTREFSYNPHRPAWPPSGVELLDIVEQLRGKATVEIISVRHLPAAFTPFLHGEKLSSERVIFDSRKECRKGDDWRFKNEPYVPDGASGWSGPVFALGNARWME